MRRLNAAFLALLAPIALLAACSSSRPTATTNDKVKVTGQAGSAPSVYIPDKSPSSNLAIKTLAQGHCPKLAAQDSYLANFAVYIWHKKSNELLLSTYKSVPEVLPVTMGLTGLKKALSGQRVGGRVLAVLPPKYGYGSKGDPQLGIASDDTMVWVIDLIQAFPPTAGAVGKRVSDGGGSLPLVYGASGTAPQMKIPKSKPPTKLVVETLIKGTGSPVQAKQTIVVKYIGEIWQSAKIFGTNWPTASEPTKPPNVVTLGKLIPAWNTGLVGVPVGSRVMLVVPPAEGYGSKGNSQAGITGSDTLVFVVDILAVV
jgi:FKBP-type peptidyl-prolyl cis-trans isomerase